MGLDITAPYSGVVSSLTVEGSHDGTTWVTLVTLFADAVPNVTGVKMAMVDFTDISVPIWRMAFNPQGSRISTSGSSSFFAAINA